MSRITRYQGAIVENAQVLLILHKQHSSGREYWVFPGGGIEAGESEEECIIREMQEETNLVVSVDCLLFDEPDHPKSVYQRRRTFLCRIISGEASPGYEPEPLAAADYAIAAVRWFNLRDTRGWDEGLRRDPITYPQLLRLREKLGFTT